MRAEAMRFPRADQMVLAKRWIYAGHVARIWTSNHMLHQLSATRDLTWWRDNERRWRSNRHFHRRPGIQRRWEQQFDDEWTNSGFEWKIVAKDRPGFDAGLKEFKKKHEAQSGKIQDDDDDTWA